MTKKCCYVLKAVSPGVEAIYCNKPTHYRIEVGEDGKRYRKYETFCPLHLMKIAEDENLQKELLTE